MTSTAQDYLLTENDLRRAYREHAGSVGDEWWGDFADDVQTQVQQRARHLGVPVSRVELDAVALVRQRKAEPQGFAAIDFGRLIERRMRGLAD